MEFTLTGLKMYNGEWVKKELTFTRRDDGTWYRTSFGDQLEEASKNGAVQSGSCGTNQAETTDRRQLSAQEIAGLSAKYDVRNMSQAQYDAFLEPIRISARSWGTGHNFFAFHEKISPSGPC